MNGRFISWFVEQPAAERFDRIVEILLAGLLAFSPLALGVVHAWSEEVVVVLSAAIGLVFLLKLVVLRSTPFVWSWAYAPVAMFIALAAFQLMPLPASWTSRISPSTVALKADLLGDLPNAREALSSVTLSFYSHATRHDLRLIVAVATVLVVVVNVYRRPERIKRLLGVIAGVGGVVALLALIQDVAGNSSIYGCVPAGDGTCSGTFLDHNHFGHFMNLSMGAALGLLCVTLQEAFTGRYVTPAGVADYLASPSGRPVIALAAMIVLGIATVFLSLTRGGMISMLIAAGFTTLMMSWRRSLRGQGWVMVLLATSAFICILYVGFDQVHHRLAALREFGDKGGGRWQVVHDVAEAWRRFPVFGVGLGTHEVIYPLFDPSVSSPAGVAKNEYAQVAEEMGATGLLSCALLGAAAWVSYGRNVRSISTPIRSAAYGLGFGVLAVLIHSVSDFGQRLPANAMLSAVCVALLIALVPAGTRDVSGVGNARGRAIRGIVRLVALVLAGGAWSWAVAGVDSERRAQASWNEA
ncbi:MAG: O-antigen ligase family protein, partial [Phycisphaerales bacterium]